jgi:hypothetical protein
VPNPTLHSPTPPALSHGRLSSLTPKGRLTVQLIRLEQLVDQLAESEQASLMIQLAILVRTAHSRVAFRKVVA